MSRLTLTKSHPCVQLAHLYEHMFVDAARDVFRQHGCYSFLDYAINGEAYDSGVIKIFIETYHKKASQLLQEVRTIDINLDQYDADIPAVSRAFFQIAAEEPELIYVRDADMMLQELATFHRTPWRDAHETAAQNISDLAITPTTNNDVMYATNQPAAPTKPIEVVFAFTETDTKLLTLWGKLAQFLGFEIGQRIAWLCGAYFADMTFDETGTNCRIILRASPLAQPHISLEKLIEITEQTATEIAAPVVMESFLTAFGNTSSDYAPALRDATHISVRYGNSVQAVSPNALRANRTI